MTPHERGEQLRRAVTESIAGGKVWYIKQDDERYTACVSYLVQVERIDNPMEVGLSTRTVGFEVDIIPGQSDYNDVNGMQVVRNFDELVHVDCESYEWAVRCLNENLVLRKLLGDEDDFLVSGDSIVGGIIGLLVNSKNIVTNSEPLI